MSIRVVLIAAAGAGLVAMAPLVGERPSGPRPDHGALPPPPTSEPPSPRPFTL